jgi:hypothetical protein
VEIIAQQEPQQIIRVLEVMKLLLEIKVPRAIKQ